MRNWKVLFAMVAAIAPVSAYAQTEIKQTPENANKFLSLSLTNLEASGNMNGGGWAKINLTSTKQIGNDICAIEMNGYGVYNYMDRTGDNSFSQGQVFVIFRDVSDVTVTGSVVYLSHPTYIAGNKVPRLGFSLPSDDLAVRVAYAMNFLKAHCNPVEQTGF
jgi:hypothetical protein